jgi:hypothetical protein
VVELTSPKKLKLVETNLEIEAEVNECTLKRTTDKDYTAVRPHSLHSDPQRRSWDDRLFLHPLPAHTPATCCFLPGVPMQT